MLLINLAHRIIVIVSGFRESILKALRYIFHLPDTQIETLYVIIYLFCVAPAYRLPTRQQDFMLKCSASGRLGKDEFFDEYGTQYGRGVADHLFDLIDKDKNGSIDMNEWVMAKKILEAGSQDERLRCA
jgi:hypothetical protein